MSGDSFLDIYQKIYSTYDTNGPKLLKTERSLELRSSSFWNSRFIETFDSLMYIKPGEIKNLLTR